MIIFKKHIGLFFCALAFSQVHAQQIYRCPGGPGGAPEYINSLRIQEFKDKGVECTLVAGGAPTLTVKDIEANRKKEKEAETKRYRHAVRANAKFLDDVDEERARNKKR